ncbi:endonuclease VIII [Entomohabitans teleogrylli]|uniref:endonuclease VIII n=1 Tax=Entomohabitans teleogrylli TaxID=1384589 RepID=UPI00073D74CD|nr:endonuclease VIII [Entomohabitans teleogrylli]
MPEGPEIRRAADRLEAAVLNKPLTDVWFAFPELATFAPQLPGECITRLETRGKALLTHFSNGLVMYSHNQLYGVWKVLNSGDAPDSKRSLRVRLATADQAILLYSASDIEMFTEETYQTHPFLQRIGPDVLDMTLTPQQVKERLLAAKFRRRQFCGLLLDQAFLAGLGNYLRVEILWEAQLTGQQRAVDLNDEQLDRLAQACLAIPRLSWQTRGQGDDNVHHGAIFRFKVFHREGQPCERCGHLIVRTMLSSRPFFWCPGCQG